MNLLIGKFSSAEIGSLGIILNSMGNIQPRSQRNIAMHMHMVYEMHILYEGEASITTEHGVHTLKKGEIALIPPHIYHSIVNVTRTFQLSSIFFQLYKLSRPDDSEEKYLHDILDAISLSTVILLKEQPEMLRITQALALAQKTEGLANSYLTNAYTTELLIYLLRALPPVAELPVRAFNKTSMFSSATQLERMDIIEDYISQHYLNASITELAQLLSLSEQHIRRFLRTNYGMSFSKLLNRHRINVSKYLLQNTAQPISEIWQLAGFHSAQNFSVAFKKYTGITASEYRAREAQIPRFPNTRAD